MFYNIIIYNTVIDIIRRRASYRAPRIISSNIVSYKYTYLCSIELV